VDNIVKYGFPGILRPGGLSSEKRRNDMSTNGIGTQLQPTSLSARRRNFMLSGIALRLFIAFVISWLIVLAFFVSGAVSH
jgi:hypothetical protein